MQRGCSTVVVRQLPKLVTRVRFPSPAVLFLLCAGCATSSSSYVTPAIGPAVGPAVGPIAPLLQPHGTVYRVQRGESLWRIARDFGVDAQTLARVNQISHSSGLKAGQQLLIPLPHASHRFLWPARGSFAKVAIGSTKALEIRVPSGTIVRASRGGRVAVSANRLADLGRTVVLDHGDGFLTIYGRMAEVAVAPGVEAPQGVPLGRTGAAPLYFEIRQGLAARDPVALLP